MYTFEQAKAKMQKFVDYQNNIFLWNYNEKTNIAILNDLTEYTDFGWIFFWQEKEPKQDFSNFVVGNGPIIIEKDTLDMYMMMTALTVNDNVAIYSTDKNKFRKKF